MTLRKLLPHFQWILVSSMVATMLAAPELLSQTLSPTRVALDSARFTVSPSSLNFGTLSLNSSKSLTVTVSNPGNIPLNVSSVTTVSTEVTIVPASATINAGLNQTFTITLNPTTSGTKAGNIVFNHDAQNDPKNSTVVPYTGNTPSVSFSQSVSPGASSGTVSLGGTGTAIQFNNTGSGGNLKVDLVNDTPPPGGFNNPDPTGTVFTPTNQYWEFTVTTPITGATFSLTFPNPNPGLSTSRIGVRGGGSGAGVTWDLVSLANTQYSGGSIIATNRTSFSQWTVVTPGNAVPTVVSAIPGNALAGKTLNVIVTGTNFASTGTTFSFGADITVNSVAAASATQATVNITIAANAPAGARDITVTNAPPGGGSATKVGGFTVGNLAPTITAASPNAGDRGASVAAVVTGTNFETGVTSVTFGAGITVTSTTINSATQLTANISIASSAAAGTRNVTVTNASPGGGSQVLTNGFTVRNLAPTLTAVSPVSGTRGSKINVTLTGTNFESGVTTAVSFGAGITVSSFTVTSATQITASIAIDAAAATGTRDVSVTNASPGGGTATKTAAFTVNTGTPTGVEPISSIVPDHFILEDVYPNPFNPSTTIRYGVPERSRVKVQVFDLLGKMVVELLNTEAAGGMYQSTWQAGAVPSGTYLVRMTAESLESGKTFSTTRKAVLLK